MRVRKIIVGFLILAMLIPLGACSDDEQGENESDLSDFYRIDKTAVVELSSGWFLFVDFEEGYSAKTDELEDAVCWIDGSNLKYQNLTEFNVPIIDSATGEVIDKIAPAVNSFSANTEYKEVLDKIEDYVLQRDNSIELSVEELDFVNTEGLLFSKEDVVEAFNAAMKNPVKISVFESGKYVHIPFDDIVKGNKMAGYSWQVGYSVPGGMIQAINIELKCSDGRYLSNFDENELSAEQKQVLEEIEIIENAIKTEQSFIAPSYDFEKKIGDVDFSRLYLVLNKIESDNSENDTD